MTTSSVHEYEIYALTDIGAVREQNEDHILASRLLKNRGYVKLSFADDDDYIARYGLLLAVADGIGGEAGGKTASRLALKTLDQAFYDYVKQDSLDAYKDHIRQAIEKVSERVVHASRHNEELANMGCTLTGICLGPSGYIVFNIGDSRVYRARNGVLRLLTRDDTVAQYDSDMGRPAESQEQYEIDNRTLTNFIGKANSIPKIEAGPVLRSEDVLLICSDGVHDLVSETTLGEILGDTEQSMAAAGERIIREALANGGRDNISLILFNVRSTAATTPDEHGCNRDQAPENNDDAADEQASMALLADTAEDNGALTPNRDDNTETTDEARVEPSDSVQGLDENDESVVEPTDGDTGSRQNPRYSEEVNESDAEPENADTWTEPVADSSANSNAKSPTTAPNSDSTNDIADNKRRRDERYDRD